MVGQIRGSVLKRYGIERAVFAAEIELAELDRRHASVRRYRPLARYPPVRRDLAIVTGPATTFEGIERTIRAYSRLPIAEVQPFDLYRGPGLPDSCASLGVTITTAAAQVNPRNRSIVRPDVRMVAPCHKTAA